MFDDGHIDHLNSVLNGMSQEAVKRLADLPRMDKADRVTKVEEVLRYSYDLLGEDDNGTTYQAWFWALGTLADGESFSTETAAALWETDADTADEFLLLLDGLALVEEQPEDGRWAQHQILRAYALSLQTPNERFDLPRRYTDHVIDLVDRYTDDEPHHWDALDADFPQCRARYSSWTWACPRRPSGW